MDRMASLCALRLTDSAMKFIWDAAREEVTLEFEDAYHAHHECHVDGVVRIAADDVVVQSSKGVLERDARPLEIIWFLDVICDTVVLSGLDVHGVATDWLFVGCRRLEVEFHRYNRWDEVLQKEEEVEPAADHGEFDDVVIVTADLFPAHIQRRYRELCIADSRARGESPMPTDPLSWAGPHSADFRLDIDPTSEKVDAVLRRADAVVVYADLGGVERTMPLAITNRGVVYRRLWDGPTSREFVRNGGLWDV